MEKFLWLGGQGHVGDLLWQLQVQNQLGYKLENYVEFCKDFIFPAKIFSKTD